MIKGGLTKSVLNIMNLYMVKKKSRIIENGYGGELP